MTSLRRRMTEDMQVRSLSPHSQATYVQQVSLFARHFNKSPELLGPEEIRSYQVHLTNERKLAPSSIILAVAALRFLYKITLHKDWTLQEVIPTRGASSNRAKIYCSVLYVRLTGNLFVLSYCWRLPGAQKVGAVRYQMRGEPTRISQDCVGEQTQAVSLVELR